jgi:hypothetical protein
VNQTGHQLFVVSFLARDTDYDPGLGQMIWSFAGAGLALVTAWLGGELVDRMGVGVEDDAHLDAPSSLKPTVKSTGLHQQS